MIRLGFSSRYVSILGLTIAVSLLVILLGDWGMNALAASSNRLSFSSSFIGDSFKNVSFRTEVPNNEVPNNKAPETPSYSGNNTCFDIDTDLYATLDGREPGPYDYDDKSTSADPNEWIEFEEDGDGDGDNVDDFSGKNIGVAVVSAVGSGSFEVTVELYKGTDGWCFQGDCQSNTLVESFDKKIGSLPGAGTKKVYYFTMPEGLSEYKSPADEHGILISLNGDTGSDPGEPGKPQNLIVNKEDDEVQLEWDAPGNDVNVDSYTIYRSNSSFEIPITAESVATVDGEVTETNVELPQNIPNDAELYYAVQASGGEDGCPGPLSEVTAAGGLIASLKPPEVSNGTDQSDRKFRIAYRPLINDDVPDPTINSTTVTVGAQDVEVVEIKGSSITARIPVGFTTGNYNVVVTDEINEVTSTAPQKLNIFEPAGGGPAPVSFSGSNIIPSGSPSSPSSSAVAAAQPAAKDATTADVDDDGDQDVISVHPSSGEITWYENQDGKGQFSSANVISGNMGGTDQVVTADLSGNGDPDVLAASSDSLVWFANNDGTYSSAITITQDVGNISSAIARDLDRDGFVDVLAADATAGTVSRYRNKGEGYITDRFIIDETLGKVSALAAADVDQDGDLDVLVGSQDNNTVSWYENTGDGYSGGTTITSSAGGVSDLALADIDNDLDEDLIVASKDENTISWYERTSSGFSGSPNTISTDVTGVRAVAPVDAEGDGDPDIAAAAQGDGSVVLFENTGGEPYFSSDAVTVTDNATSVRDVTAATLDGDIIPDLLSVQDQDPALTFFRGHRLIDADTSAVSSDQTVNFEEIGVRIGFSGTSGSGDVVAKKFAREPNGQTGIADSIVSQYRFTVSTSGDLTVGSGTEVGFDVSALGGIESPSNVTVYKRSTAGSGEFSALETSYDSGENELVVTTDSFSEFVMASNSEPLPVELAEFSGTTVGGDQVRLKWKTTSEQSNAGFAVERRQGDESARLWREIGFVESKASGGTSSNSISYQFADSGLPDGADVLTYRLRQVDIDGSTSYSKKITVRRGVEETSLGVYPNPVRNQATVRLAVPRKERVQVSLLDVLGRKVRTVVDGPQEGRRTVQVEVSDLPSGTYFLRMKAGEKTLNRKLTVVQ